jgi:hypothetical protein
MQVDTLGYGTSQIQYKYNDICTISLVEKLENYKLHKYKLIVLMHHI